MKRKLVQMIFILILTSSSLAAEKAKVVENEGKIVARVNDKVITLQQFKEFYGHIPHSLSHKISDKGKKRSFLDEMITREVLYQEALKAGLDKDKDILRKIADFKKRIIVEEFKRQAQEDRKNKVKVSDEDIKSYYNSHKDEFKDPELVRIAQIMVKSEKDARDIIIKLSRGAEFAEFARNYSIDYFAQQGGDLGYYYPLEKISFKYRRIVSKLKIGDISAPVSHQNNYKIFKLLDRKGPKQKDLKEVKENIREMLLQREFEANLNKWIDESKSKAKIIIFEDLLYP